MNSEFNFLKIIQNTLTHPQYLGDDCAYLDEYKLALSCDALIQDVHFCLSYMTPYEIAKKALLVNISDVIASGAKPEYALISLSGKFDNDFIKDFYEGIDEIAKKYNVKIIGGDLTRADKISISITAIGNYKNRKISSRKNASTGYIVATAGEFGSSRQGLEILQKKDLTYEKAKYFIDYHKNPPLNMEIAFAIAQNAEYPYAMMDSSDGLIDCLYQISHKSNVKINVEYDKIPKKIQNRDFVLFGGEDYSLVTVLHKKDFKKIQGLTKIGECSDGQGVFIDGKKIEYKGFNHFE